MANVAITITMESSAQLLSVNAPKIARKGTVARSTNGTNCLALGSDYEYVDFIWFRLPRRVNANRIVLIVTKIGRTDNGAVIPSNG